MQPLSIIVPIYNVAKYLPECLDSVAAQTHSNFQAILVNDGSTDESGAIADSYAAKDSRFIAIHQKNQGLGAARNAGLNFIFSEQNTQKTAYIGMLDSDDVLSKDYYSNLIYCLEANNCMIAKTRDMCVFHDAQYDKAIFEHTHPQEKGIVRTITSHNLTEKIDPPRSLFRAELIRDLRFPPVRFAEDVPFGVCANVLAKRVAMTKSARYFYRMRAGSLTKKSHPPQEFFNAFAFIYEFFKEHDLLHTYILPTHIIRPSESYEYLADNGEYLPLLQEFIQSLNISSEVLAKNKVLQIALQANSLEEFLKRTQTFKEWRRRNFRISLNKKHKIIKIFGKTLMHR